MDDHPFLSVFLVLLIVAGILFTGAGFGYKKAESKYKNEFFQERIKEHACKVQEVRTGLDKSIGSTCIQPDGQIFSK